MTTKSYKSNRSDLLIVVFGSDEIQDSGGRKARIEASRETVDDPVKKREVERDETRFKELREKREGKATLIEAGVRSIGLEGSPQIVRAAPEFYGGKQPVPFVLLKGLELALDELAICKEKSRKAAKLKSQLKERVEKVKERFDVISENHPELLSLAAGELVDRAEKLAARSIMLIDVKDSINDLKEHIKEAVAKANRRLQKAKLYEAEAKPVDFTKSEAVDT